MYKYLNANVYNRSRAWPSFSTIALLGTLLFGHSSKAGVIEYKFAGTITNVAYATPSVVSSIYTGSMLSATFRIDLSTVVDRDGPSYFNGNYWALTPTNQVTISLGDFRFTTKTNSTHPATIQTHVAYVALPEVVFYAFGFDSPQFADTGSGTEFQVVLRDEVFDRTLPITLPGVGQLKAAEWSMSLLNKTDRFSVSGSLNAVSVAPVDNIPQSPTLQISLAGTNAILAWSKEFTNCVLETAAQLGAVGSWTVVTSTPHEVGQSLSVTNQMEGSSRFFRLRAP